jgi:hypothetical protein
MRPSYAGSRRTIKVMISGCTSQTPGQHDFLVKVAGVDRMAEISSALQRVPPDLSARRRTFNQTVRSA